MRVELTPLSKFPRGAWRETCQQCLEALRRCIFVDKDLVLPPTGSSSPIETFFVVASTDMQRVTILMDRIRDQVGRLPQLQANGTMRVVAEMIPATPAVDPRTLEQQVWGVADYVTDIVQQGLWSKPNSNHNSNSNSNSNDKEKQ